MRHYSEKNHGTYTRVDKRGLADLPKSSTHKVGGYIVTIEAYNSRSAPKGYLFRVKWDEDGNRVSSDKFLNKSGALAWAREQILRR